MDKGYTCGNQAPHLHGRIRVLAARETMLGLMTIVRATWEQTNFTICNEDKRATLLYTHPQRRGTLWATEGTR